MNESEVLDQNVKIQGVTYNLAVLNELFRPLTPTQRIAQLYDVFEEKDVLYTSSFGTKSVFLLDLIQRVRPSQRVHFVDTTYHFPETISYKESLTAHYNLNLVDILPDKKQNDMTTEEQWWKEHPRMCCTINKIAPLEPTILEHKVWISGLMSDQTGLRSKLNIFERNGDIIKFHPIIDANKEDVAKTMLSNNLLEHPLQNKGYGSVGCTNCTQQGEDRSGRWCNTTQTECGLHTSYFLKKKEN